MISDYAKGYQDGKVAKMQRIELSEEQKELVRELIEAALLLVNTYSTSVLFKTREDRVIELEKELGL